MDEMQGMINRLVRRRWSGFAGVDGLRNAEDFMSIAQRAVNRAEALIAGIDRVTQDEHVVGVLDEISDSVCRVADVANFCYCIHPEETWRRSSAQSLQFLSHYLNTLNTNEHLFTTLNAALKKNSPLQSWSAESVIVGESFHRDFITGGVSSKCKDAIREIITTEQKLALEFQKCAVECREIRALSLTDTSKLPEPLRDACVPRAGQKHLLMTPTYYSTVVHSIQDAAIRKAAYLAHYQSLESNLITLQELLKTRYQWAQELGYTSFAHLKLQDSIAKDPDSVESFLKKIAAEIKPEAMADLASLEQRKGGEIQPWDVPYWTNTVQGEAKQRHGSRILTEFDLQSVINGISQLLLQLMGIEMNQIEVDHLWDPCVQFFEFREGDSVIGHLYLDPMTRKHKRPENAHYTLRCGRERNDGSYQTPIVALVTNFSRRELSFHELKALLHEFGHVLHSLLSKTRYQHLFGTRGPLDLVEIPSHFFERLLTTPVTLSYMIGPKQRYPLLLDLQRTIDVNSMFSSLALIAQIQFALADQLLHAAAFQEGKQSTSDVLEQVAAEIGVVPHVKGTYREAWMTHLTSYGARYYAYIFSRHIAQSIWTKRIEADVLNKNQWHAIRQRLLQPGSAIHPQEYVNNLIGKDTVQPISNER